MVVVVDMGRRPIVECQRSQVELAKLPCVTRYWKPHGTDESHQYTGI